MIEGRFVIASFGPDFGTLEISEDNAEQALQAFRINCPAVVSRDDQTDLTETGDWMEVCRSAAQWDDDDARDFFAEKVEHDIADDLRATQDTGGAIMRCQPVRHILGSGGRGAPHCWRHGEPMPRLYFNSHQICRAIAR